MDACGRGTGEKPPVRRPHATGVLPRAFGASHRALSAAGRAKSAQGMRAALVRVQGRAALPRLPSCCVTAQFSGAHSALINSCEGAAARRGQVRLWPAGETKHNCAKWWSFPDAAELLPGITLPPHLEQQQLVGLELHVRPPPVHASRATVASLRRRRSPTGRSPDARAWPCSPNRGRKGVRGWRARACTLRVCVKSKFERGSTTCCLVS